MAEDILELTSGLHRFLEAGEATILAGRKAAQEAKERLVQRAHRLAQRVTDARRDAASRVSERLGEISLSLRNLVQELDERRTPQDDVRATWKTLGQQYEALVESVRRLRLPAADTVKLARLKPRNYARNLFHASIGLISVAMYLFLFGRTTLIIIGSSILASFIFMDILRRVSPTWNERFVDRVFGAISRPEEAYRIPSATWYLVALLIGVIFLPRDAVCLGALVLALGDPAAALAGRAWGKRKLLGDKSYAGTLAFVLVSSITCGLYLWLVVPGMGPLRALPLAGALALGGAAAELFSTRVDDNLTISLTVSLLAFLLI